MLNNLILSGIVATTILASGSAYTGGNNNVGGELNNNKNIEVKKDTKNYIYVADVPLYKGKIAEITPIKDGINLLVTNASEDNSTYPSLIFHITKDTNLNIKKEDLKIGDTLDIFYSGAVTRSLPGQASAIAVNKVQETFICNGEINKVIETNFGQMISVTPKNEDAKFEEIIFHISDKTKFTNGNTSGLKAGTKVKVTYGPAMTMSLPPQTSALNIEFSK